ncbi:MAG: DUF1543 domain-containing protein [Chitinophagaceae bacterium]|nr:MAG: DUF1543 domain-containing protein [Chitinophagaceae bacterium]
MLLIGCLPKNRNVEQHDVFFGIGENVKEVMEQAIASWPEAGNSFHLDAWREVTLVDGYRVLVLDYNAWQGAVQLYFINLGGYKQNEFEEFHYKMLVASPDKNEALKAAKQTAFFRHTGFKGAPAHIDEKYGVDVDNIYSIRDILPAACKSKYSIIISSETVDAEPDIIHLGYFRPGKVDDWGI